MNSEMMLLLAACLLTLSSASMEGITERGQKTDASNPQSLTVLPINLVSKLGDTVTLTCESAHPMPDCRVQWSEFITRSDGQLMTDNAFVFPGHKYASRYSLILDSPTSYNLQIHNVSVVDGGTYVCEDVYASAPVVHRGQAELVVLESDPNCTSSIPSNGYVFEGNNYTISCEVKYTGNLEPKMTWTGPKPFITITVTSENKVISTVSFTAARSFDGKMFQCHTHFSSSIVAASGVASNAPAYDHYYQSPELHLSWPPESISAAPLYGRYLVGEVITCFADANPPAYYQWQNMRTLDVIASQFYNITETDAGYNTTLRCLAQNIINGFLYARNLFIEAYVTDASAPCSTTTTKSTTTSPSTITTRLRRTTRPPKPDRST